MVVAGLLAIAGLTAPACSSDDTAPADMVAQGSDRQWCEAVIRWHQESAADRSASTGDPIDRAAAERSARAYAEIDAPPPSTIAADVATVSRALQAIATGDTTNLPDQSSFMTASNNVTVWVFQNCGGYNLNS